MIAPFRMSRFRRSALLMGAALFIAPSFAMAQNPVFQPASNWQVGQAQIEGLRGLEGMGLPCVLSVQYDNGFDVRFSGGGGIIQAMAIDFRQDVFRAGRKYAAMLSIGDNYSKQVSGTAFSASTMIFNLRGVPDFYERAQKAQQMELNIADNAMVFSLSGFAQGAKSLERCYDGTVAETAPQQPGRNFTPPMQALPQNFSDIVANGSAANSNATAAPVSITPRDIPAWNAAKGEDIRTVLNRWADRAGYDLKWQAAHDGVVGSDVALNGSFEEAVAQLLAMNKGSSSLKSRVEKSPQGAAPAQAVGSAMGSTWSAPAGADLQSVLQSWARRAGVKLVWDSNARLSIPRAVNESGAFEAAVQSLLDQYQGATPRPTGRLNMNPAGGQRTLTITTG